MTDLVFMDTECLGLHRKAPIWEFAALRRRADGSSEEFHCFIQHNVFKPGQQFCLPEYRKRWDEDLPESFQQDYMDRFDPDSALPQSEAAALVYAATRGAHIIGAVPSFDTERLARLLRKAGIKKPPWHYHLIDIENLVLGYLHGNLPQLVNLKTDLTLKSDQLSELVGVDPAEFARHTAMGDVKWAAAQWDAITGGAR